MWLNGPTNNRVFISARPLRGFAAPRGGETGTPQALGLAGAPTPLLRPSFAAHRLRERGRSEATGRFMVSLVLRTMGATTMVCRGIAFDALGVADLDSEASATNQAFGHVGADRWECLRPLRVSVEGGPAPETGLGAVDAGVAPRAQEPRPFHRRVLQSACARCPCSPGFP